MRYRDLYQFFLILFAFGVLFGVGVFFYRELFPEYKLYQTAYKELEDFRSSYTGEKPAPFRFGIQQILIPDPDQGPEVIDRCTSCHLAMDLPHFSKTRLALDINDEPLFDEQGNPILEPNPDYIFLKLANTIEGIEDEASALRLQGKDREASALLEEAARLKEMQTVSVEGREISLDKVLTAHPLIGGETRPFENHPVEEYGCTTCHNGNGRALEAKRAHGPVFDGTYPASFMGPRPSFLEEDVENDPLFSKMYNHKPAHSLAFQTTPLFIGPLMEAKCAQCHLPTSSQLRSSLNAFDQVLNAKEEQVSAMKETLFNEKQALIALLTLLSEIKEKGEEATFETLDEKLGDSALSFEEIDRYEGQRRFLEKHKDDPQGALFQEILAQTGDEKLTKELIDKSKESAQIPEIVTRFFEEHPSSSEEAYEKEVRVLTYFQKASAPLASASQNKEEVQQLSSTIDTLMGSYRRGKELYISQSCYACHRIAGFSRASVGPELTQIGLSYPWYVKESIVWPQADLASSTMPNFRLDHEEIADLMAFLMAQTGSSKVISEVDYEVKLKEWEAGALLPWEKPLSPTQIDDLNVGMEVFATEGCAACHKLQGFTAPFTLEESRTAFFEKHFPEAISGKALTKTIEKLGGRIDEMITHEKGSFLEKLEERFPGLIIGFYPNFRFASRAQNQALEGEALDLYLLRLKKVLYAYIESYGLGRDIAPHLNYSGVYRSDAWLMGHFHNPTAYTAKSIMPVMPFDDTKFYTLNTLLHQFGKENRDKLHLLWDEGGFSPPRAYEILCSSCHGEERQGNGLISEWIYPIPKNLRNPVFLGALTKSRAFESIMHGVEGTPMPPWGEAAPGEKPVLSQGEVVQLVDWLYQDLPSSSRSTNREEEKWGYSAEDVVEEMRKERHYLQPKEESVAGYFEVRKNPIPSPDKELYYIKEMFYTDQNLSAGKAYYDVHCATCHGKDGTGTGLRASSMVEAKPRMLTNLPWIRTRDDLRFLRSIKYGVLGTAMTPWGDQTSSALRMQLVMYIRSLSERALLQDDLDGVLYERFEAPQLLINRARVPNFTLIEKGNKRLQAIEEELFLTEELSPEAQGALYAEKVNLERELEKLKAKDQEWQTLIELLKEEKKIFRSLGLQLIMKERSKELVERFFEIIKQSTLTYTFDNEKLELVKPKALSFKPLMSEMNERIEAYNDPIAQFEAKIDDPERGEKIKELMGLQREWINLKTEMETQVKKLQEIQDQQRLILT